MMIPLADEHINVGFKYSFQLMYSIRKTVHGK